MFILGKKNLKSTKKKKKKIKAWILLNQMLTENKCVL